MADTTAPRQTDPLAHITALPPRFLWSVVTELATAPGLEPSKAIANTIDRTLLDRDEASIVTNISFDYMDELLAASKIPSYVFEGKRLIRFADVIGYIEAMRS